MLKLAKRPLWNAFTSPIRSLSRDRTSSSVLDLMPDKIAQVYESDHPGHNMNNIDVLPRKYGTVDPKTYDPSTDRPGQSLFRADDFPFNPVQPGFNTKKSHVNEKLELEPVDAKGSTTPALHVHGKPADKAQSPYSSTTVNPAKASSYGQNLLEFDLERLNADQIVSQDAIQSDIKNSPDPRLDEEARNVTQPGKPLWQPSPEQRALAPGLNIDRDKPMFNLRERAALNSKRDEESFLTGSVPVHQYWHGIPYDKFGANLSQYDSTQDPRFEKRDPRSHFPPRSKTSGGFRIPVDEYGFEFARRMAKYRQEQAEINLEREEDEKYRKGQLEEKD